MTPKQKYKYRRGSASVCCDLCRWIYKAFGWPDLDGICLEFEDALASRTCTSKDETKAMAVRTLHVCSAFDRLRRNDKPEGEDGDK